MMIYLFRRNPYLRIRNGAASNPQTDLSPFTLSFFSSASNLPNEAQSAKIKEPVLDFFHSYGFTDPQIRRFIHKYPSVRSTQTVKPKLEHLLAYGFPPSELVRMISLYPRILDSSLKERIEPNLNLLEATIGSKTHIIKAIFRGPWLITRGLEKYVIPTIKILRDHSIPMDRIIRLFTRYPTVLVKNPNLLIETIAKLKGLGMSPSTLAFVHGLNAIAELKKETRERKMELYRSFGWSEEDTLSAFSRQPNCLGLSDDNLEKKMKFFKEKLQWDSTILAKSPVLLSYSLEGRIIPRCAVMNVLANRKLWEGNPSLISLFYMSEKKFEERFVDKYEKEVPQVTDAYQGKIDFVGFESIGREVAVGPSNGFGTADCSVIQPREEDNLPP